MTQHCFDVVCTLQQVVSGRKKQYLNFTLPCRCAFYVETWKLLCLALTLKFKTLCKLFRGPWNNHHISLPQFSQLPLYTRSREHQALWWFVEVQEWYHLPRYSKGKAQHLFDVVVGWQPVVAGREKKQYINNSLRRLLESKVIKQTSCNTAWK